MSTFGYLGAFPAGLTTGFQNIGAVQETRTSAGWPGAFPSGLTTGSLNIGAVQLAVPAVVTANGNMILCF